MRSGKKWGRALDVVLRGFQGELEGDEGKVNLWRNLTGDPNTGG